MCGEQRWWLRPAQEATPSWVEPSSTRTQAAGSQKGGVWRDRAPGARKSRPGLPPPAARDLQGETRSGLHGRVSCPDVKHKPIGFPFCDLEINDVILSRGRGRSSDLGGGLGRGSVAESAGGREGRLRL